MITTLFLFVAILITFEYADYSETKTLGKISLLSILATMEASIFIDLTITLIMFGILINYIFIKLILKDFK